MEVFKIFATMSLHDAVSKPLAAIRASMSSTEGVAGRLSSGLGKLAIGLGVAAVGGAAFLGVLSSTIGEAIAFESKMADVAKVADFESTAELEEMSRALQDLSLQIPITAAGFADIAAAALQSGVAKDDLIEFSTQAAKMGVAFDVTAGEASKTMADWRASMGLTLQETYSLADSVNYLSNKMNATASDISEVLNRAGAVGKSVGLTSQQVSALAATILSSGADASIAGTGLNNLFTSLADGASMSKSAAAAFKSMGFDISKLGAQMQADAQGTIMRVMEGIASLSKDKQISAIKAIFGDMGVKNIAPMVGNLDNLRQAFGLVGDAANYAGSMEAEYASRSATTENSIQLLKNSLNVFRITIGSMFLPAVNSMVKGISWLVQVFIKAARSEFGAFLIKLAAATSAALIGVTGLVAAFIFLKPAILMVAGVLSTVFWPVMLVAGAVALLALAWKKNFMGIATTVTNFANKVKLVFQGVYELFSTLKDGKGELSAELAEKIEAAGLMGLVTTLFRIGYRIMNFFQGLAEGFKTGIRPALDRLGDAFKILGEHLRPLGNMLTGLAEKFGLAAGGTDVLAWKAWGHVIGEIAGGVLGFFIVTLGVVVGMITAVVDAINWLVSAMDKLPKMEAEEAAMNHSSPFMGGGFNAQPVQPMRPVEEAITAAAPQMAAAAGEAMNGVESEVNAVNFYTSGQRLMTTLAAGINAGTPSAVASINKAMGAINAHLPHSDAEKGPLSTLTASGMAIPGTLARGIGSGTPALVNAAENMLAGLNLAPPYHELPPAGSDLPEPSFHRQDGGSGQSLFSPWTENQTGGRNITININHIDLPNVKDADGFVASLEAIVAERV